MSSMSNPKLLDPSETKPIICSTCGWRSCSIRSNSAFKFDTRAAIDASLPLRGGCSRLRAHLVYAYSTAKTCPKAPSPRASSTVTSLSGTTLESKPPAVAEEARRGRGPEPQLPI